MTTLAVVQSCYIPWKGYFDLIRRADAFVLYDCVQYTDRDWRNRNRIKTPHGLQWLTIPVHSSRQHTIAQVACAGQEWRATHWRALQHAYAKAPYFKDYADLLATLYAGEETMLSEINKRFLSAFCEAMEIKTPLHLLTERHDSQADKTDRLIAVCQQYQASRYLTGPSASSYLDVKKFEQAGIEVEWMEYHYSEYPQLYPPFEHGVSVLDMLFSVGSSWVDYCSVAK